MKEHNYKVQPLLFRFSWVLLLAGIICDYNVSPKTKVLIFENNIPTSSIVVIIFIFVFLINGGMRYVLEPFRNKNERLVVISLGVLLAATYLSSILSMHREIALGTTIFRYSLFYICFICIIAYSYYIKGSVNFIIWSFIFANVFIIITLLLDYYLPFFNKLLIEHFGHMEERHITLERDPRLMRPSGFITEVNLAAMSIMISNLIILINIDKIKLKWIPYIFFAASGYAFGMIVSRSTIFGLIISLILLGILKKVKLKKIIVFALIFLAAQALTPQSRYRIAAMFQKENIEGELAVSRPVIWRAALRAYETQPITGIGIGVFFDESLHYIDELLEEQYKENSSPRNKAALDFWKQWRYGVNPHSILVAMLTETGIIGFVCFLFAMFFFGQNLVKSNKLSSLILFGSILFISSFASFAPYYKFYLIICVIIYIAAKQDMDILIEQ